MAARIALLLALCGCFPKDWRKQDQALENASLVFLMVDWQQTMDITANCSEANPIIGECGQRVDPAIYFPVVLLGSVVVSRLLSPSLRTAFQGALLGAEVATVWDNTQH